LLLHRKRASLLQEPKIALIAKNIDTALALQVVNAKGMYVSPGLIDIHTHVFYGHSKSDYLSNGSIAVIPDSYTFRTGVTTVVDAGGAGWKSFQTFKKNIIDISATRVLSMLNIVGEGMRGGEYEQNLDDMDADKDRRSCLRKQGVCGRF
jgi:dihydroorotase